MRGATSETQRTSETIAVSIHAPHAGRDMIYTLRDNRRGCFNPRAPCGARRTVQQRLAILYLFQSTRPMRGATRRGGLCLWETKVSIHAPHAGRDRSHRQAALRGRVSIHAPHAGRDHIALKTAERFAVSIHAPHAGRDLVFSLTCVPARVSIHAPHAGRDRGFCSL